MSVLVCVCGYSCGTRKALDRHISKLTELAPGSKHGPNVKTESILQLSSHFDEHDPNGDRRLDYKELTALLRRGQATITDAEIRMLFDAADKNQDEHVDFDEFLGVVFSNGDDDVEATPASPANASMTADMFLTGSRGSLKLDRSTTSLLDSPVRESSPGPEMCHSRTEPVRSLARPKKDDEEELLIDRRTGETRHRSSFASAPLETPKCRTQESPKLGSTSPARNGRAGTVRLWIVRHGKSANKSRAKGEAASLDPELSEAGYEQAEACGCRIAKGLQDAKNGDVIIASSPMQRCLLTIRPSIYKLNIAPDDIRCHGACYEFGCAGLGHPGATPSEIAEVFPEFNAVGFRRDSHWDYRGSNEKENEVEARARTAVIVDWIWEVAAELRARASNRAKTLVLSFHQSIADLVCQLLVDGTTDNWIYGEMQYKLQNTGITEIILLEDGQAKIGSFQNDCKHIRNLVVRQNTGLTRETSSAKMVAKMRTQFSKIDKSGDRKLDLREMSELLRKGDPRMSDDEIWLIFSQADTTNDGDVDFDEFVNFLFAQGTVT